MSITPTIKSRTTRAKIALIPALSLGLFVGSAAFAAPAHAHDDDSIRGCTVKPLKPTDERGNWVNFRISVKCEDGKRTVHIRQIRYEADRGSDTRLGDDYFVRHLDHKDDYKIIDSLDHVQQNLDRHGSEEVYHKVSFAVENANGHLSDWSDWEKSEVLRDVNVH
ncbi:hypothetical protein QFZ36_002060 [Pseudarthrobacter siccitolerans]|uniref:Uncharacterized protein n=1 Tax=Pseudarthrobacter siccitolerans TaxID=861266 RepID=A0ABU0PKK8_9MICC|nr:hypothetical protein [Pseudarthrobacter siccitolerans]MDQ0674499.1 hypothetical protein [Pseudarthrobacter siccitolerans]